MIVLDTHAWLWLRSDPARLSDGTRAAIAAADGLGVCTISCWELGMLVRAGRVRLDRDARTWIRQALAFERMAAIPLTADAAVTAALLPDHFPGDPADRIIYATALGLGARLVTRDERISSFDPPRTLW